MSFAECSLTAWRALQETSQREAFAAYCHSKYELLPFFHWFLRLGQHFWPLVALALAAMPLIFLNVKYTADEFMSKAIMRFQKRFRISALVGAVTLIPLSNAGPDLIVTFVSSQKDQGEDIAMGSLLGAFIFVSTIATGYAVLRSPRPAVPVARAPLVKDIAFYGLGVLTVVLFGFLQRTQRFYFALPLALLFGYIAASLYLAQQAPKEQEDAFDGSWEASESGSEAYLGFVSYASRHLYSPAAPLSSLLFLPFKLFYMLVVPYNENPLARTQLICVIAGVSAALSACALGLPPHLGLMAGLMLGTALLVLAVGAVESLAPHRKILLDFLTLVAAIAFMKVFTDALLGCINFLSFVLGVNEAYLSMIVLSIGMSVSDLFSNGAISASGDDVMAVMGCISSQIFNLLAGVSGYVLFNLKGTFDIFGLGERGVASEKGLFVVLIAFTLGALGLNLAHVLANGQYRKNFAVYSAVFYAGFLAITAVYSTLTK